MKKLSACAAAALGLMAIASGALYTVEHFDKSGKLLSSETTHNLAPTEGLTHMASVIFAQGAQVSTWYIAPFEGNYTPVPGVTAATFAAAATESTAYTPTARVAFVESAPVAGACDNSANKAEFTFTADKVIYGAGMLSSSPKASTTGTLISIIRFASPKTVTVGDMLRVTAAVAFTSV